MKGYWSHLFAVVCITSAMGAACTPGERQTAKTVIDLAGYACIIANADLPDSSAIAKVCTLEADLGPAIKQIIDDFKMKRAAYASAKMAASHCPESK